MHDDQLDLIFKPFENHDLELQIPVDEEELYRFEYWSDHISVAFYPTIDFAIYILLLFDSH